jgi:CTP:molybdopterin cytidylyltransferase MocA
MAVVTGLVLAAGRGERYGGPKALAVLPDGRAWLTVVAETLAAAGLPVIAALPSGLIAAADLLPPGARAVFVGDESGGISDSVRAAFSALDAGDSTAALITTVDSPALPTSAVDRILEARPVEEASLVRAVYRERPGHPVLIGRAHWPALTAGLSGDRGAGPYLAAQHALEVECGDLWSGDDIDTRPQAPS